MSASWWGHNVGSSRLSQILLLSIACGASGCSGSVRRFPLTEPLWVDADLSAVSVPCRNDDSKPGHKVCTPELYVSSFAWDGADNIIFRPISDFFAVKTGREAINVNAFDEVPDSAWFTNRIGRHPMTVESIMRGFCDEHVLSPDSDPPGSWLIDQGKPNGANPGFRVRLEGAGKFMLKADDKGQPEKASGATAIATRLYYAAGWWAPCDSVVYIHPELLKLKPGLTVTANDGVTRPFDEPALAGVLARASKRGDLTRMGVSKWLPGRILGPFTYSGTRPDDPQDVVPHEDRRDLRGARVMAAWLGHFDSREQNSMDTWLALDPSDPDSSPGVVRHWYLDLGDCFGSEWDWDGVTRRLNHAYYLDIPYLVEDFFTLGLIVRPWDRAERSKAGDVFAYFSEKDFAPEMWRGGYPNPTFNRMTERDAAWATRIIARFTHEAIDAAVRVADFSRRDQHEFLLHALEERRRRILERYFSKLSPIGDLRLERGATICGVDLASLTATYPKDQFRYSAAWYRGADLDPAGALEVKTSTASEVCVTLPHFAEDGGARDDDPSRYAVVDVLNGSAKGPLRAHLYDLGRTRGYRLVGIERPRSAGQP
jgi:hypothetical protein